MNEQSQTSLLSFFILFALLLAGGCAVLDEAFAPGGLSGMTTPPKGQRVLTEPKSPPEAVSYAAENTYQTLAVPVRLKVPDRDLNFTVSSVKANVLATPYVVATFAGGEIVGREFEKVLKANFREPLAGEAPVAELAVRIAMVLVSQQSDWAPMKTELRFNIEVTNPGGSETAYSNSIESSAIGPWTNRLQIPDSFYQALSGAIAKFLDDWDRNGGPDAVARWAGNAEPGVRPPELEAPPQWEPGMRGMWRGSCTVAFNGFEVSRAMLWAHAQIKAACRTKLGDIEPERLRVVYDSEDYNPRTGTCKFSFRCFARCKQVLDYNAATGMGTVIGDLGLMKMDAEDAANVLRNYVHREMDSHAGRVDSEHRKTNAQLRFDDYRTDQASNLIIIDFHMLR